MNAKGFFSQVACTALVAAATCMGSVTHAASFPDEPLLTSGSGRPKPNIMFVLDDSGSMAWEYMPDVDPTGRNWQDFSRRNANINPLAFDPRKPDYQTWLKADGTRTIGGTSYTSAYSNTALLSGDIDLRNNTQTFFLPKTASVALGDKDPRNYYRYQIYYDSWTGQLTYTRCEEKSSTSYSFSTNCGTAAPPNPARTWAQELQNYATWYSYHRTRMKVAKAGTMEAFAKVDAPRRTGDLPGQNIRVGFDTISALNTFKIPVATNDGAFTGANRTTWFDRVKNAGTPSWTPLRVAMMRTGEYFKDRTASGPWGPQTNAVDPKTGKVDAQFSCRANFMILTTDGYWNDDAKDGNYTGPVYSGKLGNVDNKAGEKYSYENPLTGAKMGPLGYEVSPPYKDAYSDTLADVAMNYWATDLRPDLANNVPADDVDPAFWQHMSVFSMSIGMQGTLKRSDWAALKSGAKQWPDAINNSGAERIDDLWHAAVNGRGEFNVVTDTAEFERSLASALNRIGKMLAAGSNVAANSTRLDAGSQLFQATFVSGLWSGDLKSFAQSKAGVAKTPTWSASLGIPAAANRNILTYEGTKGEVFPTAAQQATFAARPGLATGLSGADVGNYLRGDQSKETQNNGTLRSRGSNLFGDIVDSSPVYDSETKVVYVGANDGMLHAIDATNGKEVFTYVPGGLDFAALATLSDPNYLHRYFVDGQIVVGSSKQFGANILVGALGRGGKGVFALDVSKPTQMVKGSVLWDSTSQAPADKDMGFVIGNPEIVKTRAGKNVVLVPNGLDSDNGNAVLYVYDALTGSQIAKIGTGVKPGNGLTAIRPWSAKADGVLDYVYATDIKGNVWKFDMTATDTANWGLGLGGQPLITAKTSAGVAQPISGGLRVATEPLTQRTWVFFGTGKYLDTADVKNTDVQSLYGVIDDGTTTSRGALQTRRIDIIGVDPGTKEQIRGFDSHSSLDAGKRGWVIDLGNPKPGERVIQPGIIDDSAYVIYSIVPGEATSCDPSGYTFKNVLDAFTGSSVSSPYFDVGNDGDKSNDTIGNDGRPVGSIGGSGILTQPVKTENNLNSSNTQGGIDTQKKYPDPNGARRVYWRELYQEK